MPYYLFRVGDNPKSYQYRCEKASGPREACKLAFGVIYSGQYHGSVMVKDIGSRKPVYLSQKRKLELYNSPDGWERVPETGK